MPASSRTGTGPRPSCEVEDVARSRVGAVGVAGRAVRSRPRARTAGRRPPAAMLRPTTPARMTIVTR